jgi:hypothetical protein
MSKKESKLAFQLFKTINKRIMKPYLFLIFFIFGLIGNAQNAQQAQEIIKEYDLNAIKQLQNKIKTLEDKDKAFAIETANKNGWPIRTVLENGGVEELIKIGPKGFPIYRRTDNVDAAVSTRTNFINSGGNLGLNIDGQGMVARVWDGGTVRRTHNGFGSRVQTVDDASGITYSDHATHVTGTIIAAPWSVASENIKGMAPLASAKTNNASTRYGKRRLSAQGFAGFSVPVSIDIAVPLAQQLLGFGKGADLAAAVTAAPRGGAIWDDR